LAFPLRDSDALAGLIEKILASPEMTVPYRKAVPAHLEAMRLERLAERYLGAFERLCFYHTIKGMGRRKAIRRTVEELSVRS